MADKRKARKRKGDDYVAPGEETEDKPSKEEFVIAKWIRKNVPIKKTKFLNHNVEYFTGKRAVDAIMQSTYAQGEGATFRSRDEVIDYLHCMLEHKFFHRARKVPVSEQELKGKKKDKKKDSESGDETSRKDTKEKNEQTKGTDAESSVVENKEAKSDKEKRKKKIRLEMHNDQRFVDSLDAYVWIYDPIPFYYWIIGTLLVLGAIGVCLFPLWPESVRVGVYYLSIAAAGFLVSIIVMAVIRLILFCLIWTLSMGKHHLWILPNLTEDVGFFASFWPLYTYEYRSNNSKKGKKKNGKKKDKDSDAENDDSVKVDEIQLHEGDEEEEEMKESKHSSEEEEHQAKSHVENLGSTVTDEESKLMPSSGSQNQNSESDSESRSSTGKDFEIVDPNDVPPKDS